MPRHAKMPCKHDTVYGSSDMVSSNAWTLQAVPCLVYGLTLSESCDPTSYVYNLIPRCERVCINLPIYTLAF